MEEGIGRSAEGGEEGEGDEHEEEGEGNEDMEVEVEGQPEDGGKDEGEEGIREGMEGLAVTDGMEGS